MLKRSLLLCGIAVLMVTVSSCILDPAPGDDKTPPPPNQTVQDLTQKSHVLNNIEVAYNKRQWEVYDALLDQGFTFFFYAGDVGEEIPAQWNRTDELAATTELFLSNKQTPTPPSPVCRSVRMDIHFDNVQWVEVIPEQFPDETWYTTTLFYEFVFEMEPDQTFQSLPSAKAQFTVRNVPQDGKDHWQLVEFHDLGNGV
jgi:hypothetical protein